MLFRLLEEVLDCQKMYNGLLKKTLEDQKDQMSLLKSVVDQNLEISCECRCQDYNNFNYENNTNSKDLVEWLCNMGVDKHSIKKVCNITKN